MVFMFAFTVFTVILTATVFFNLGAKIGPAVDEELRTRVALLKAEVGRIEAELVETPVRAVENAIARVKAIL